MRHLPIVLAMAGMACTASLAPARAQDAESQVYSAVKSCSGYSAFIRNYPNSRFVADAREHIARDCQPKPAAPAKAAPATAAPASAPAATAAPPPAPVQTAAAPTPTAPLPELKACKPKVLAVDAAELPLGGDISKLLQAGNTSCARGVPNGSLNVTVLLCDGAPATVQSVQLKAEQNTNAIYEMFGAVADQHFQSIGKKTWQGGLTAKDVGSDLVYLRIAMNSYGRLSNFTPGICSLKIDATPK